MEEPQDLREDLGKISFYLQSYFTHSTQLAKLELAEAVGKLSALFIANLVVFTLVGLGCLLLSVALLLFLATWFGNFGQAFLSLGALFVGLGSLLFWFRNRLFIRPITLTIVKILYEKKP